MDAGGVRWQGPLFVGGDVVEGLIEGLPGVARGDLRMSGEKVVAEVVLNGFVGAGVLSSRRGGWSVRGDVQDFLARTAGLDVAREGKRGPKYAGKAEDRDGKEQLHSLELRIARRCGFVQDIWGRGNCTMVAGTNLVRLLRYGGFPLDHDGRDVCT